MSIKVDTDKVEATASTISKINSEISDKYGLCLNKLNSLYSSWNSISCDSVKNKWARVNKYEDKRRKTFNNHYKTLVFVVSGNFKAVEESNKKLSELFKWGSLCILKLITASLHLSITH